MEGGLSAAARVIAVVGLAAKLAGTLKECYKGIRPREDIQRSCTFCMLISRTGSVAVPYEDKSKLAVHEVARSFHAPCPSVG